jgi:uncharacterized protein (DUF1501 family)
MKRRQFLQSGSIMSLPIFLGGLEVSAFGKSSLFNLVNNGDDRVLVLIQLNGGNDGLNMVIPLDQYSGLSQVRPTLMLPENTVLKLTDKTGLHPVMSGLQQLYQEEKLAVVQSVGYPNQNRSHFRSTDIWTSGSDADKFLTTGWAGRYLDQKYPGFPAAYPNADCPDPFAITIGNVVSETCQGPSTNFSFTLVNEASIRLVEETVAAPADSSCYSNEVEYIRNTIQQSNAYATNVLNAFQKGNNIVTYPENNVNRLANQLKVVANLISGGLGTKIYVVNIGGFDTHANQVQLGETEVLADRNHAVLLKEVSDAVAVFLADCTALGISERVVGMTFSEFGRQIKANNSLGTDHGTAAPLIVFGDCVNQGVFGQNPEISVDIAPQEGVPMQYDFRSVYASLLIDWLGASESEVKNVLYNDFQKIPFIKDCSVSSSASDTQMNIEASLSPNPCSDFVRLSFYNQGNNVRVSLLNALGAELEIPVNKSLAKEQHNLTLSVNQYPSGSYFVRIAVDNAVRTLKFVKI